MTKTTLKSSEFDAIIIDSVGLVEDERLVYPKCKAFSHEEIDFFLELFRLRAFKPVFLRFSSK